MFKIDQKINVKVVGKKEILFDLSMIPSQINKTIKISDIEVGSLLCGFISQIKKGDYTIETGINNLGAILKNDVSKKEYNVGDYIVYSVLNIEHSIFGTSSVCVKDVSPEHIILKSQPVLPAHLVRVKIIKRLSKVESRGIIFKGKLNVLVRQFNSKLTICVGNYYDCYVTSVDPTNKTITVSPCSKQKYQVTEETKNDVNIGDYVEIVVDDIKSHGITGHIFNSNKEVIIFNSDKSLTAIESGQKQKGRVIAYNKNHDTFQVTLRQEYLIATAKLLTNINGIAVGARYIGTVIKEFETFYVVQFCNHITGTVSKALQNNRNIYVEMINEFEVTRIKNGKQQKIYLKCVDNDQHNDEGVGEEFRGIIIQHDLAGSRVQILGEENDQRLEKGFEGKAAFLKEGDEFTCVKLGNGVYSVRDLEYFKEYSLKSFEDVEENDILRGFVKYYTQNNLIELFVPLKGGKHFYTLKLDDDKSKFSQNQIMNVKVIEINSDGIQFCSKLLSVWSDFDDTFAYVCDSLRATNLRNGKFNIGDKFEGKVFKVEKFMNNLINVQLKNKNFEAHLTVNNDVKENDSLSGYIAWINPNGSFELTENKLKDHERSLSQYDSINGYVVSNTHLFNIAVASTKKYVMIIPKYLHYNDNIGEIESFTEINDAKYIVLGYYDKFIIVVPEKYFKTKSLKSNKRKLSQIDLPVSSTKKSKSKINDALDSEIETADHEVPTITNFWSSTLTSINSCNTSALDDNNETSDVEVGVKTKKKLTSAEKREQFKKEEARIREIEETLAKSIVSPETADHFDRLLIANPNDSMIWIKYMAHHLQSAEIDKARNIGRIALKKISFRDEEEKLNVWIALLNLEIRYGTPETFTEVFDEALRINDPYRVHEKCLDIYVGASMIDDTHNLIGKMIKKFKSNMNMWLKICTIYFEIGEADKAKKVLSRSLTSLNEKDR